MFQDIKLSIQQNCSSNKTWFEFLHDYSTGSSYALTLWKQTFKHATPTKTTNLIIKGSHVIYNQKKLKVFFANCCLPIYKDESVGLLSRKRLIVHTTDCINVMHSHAKKIPVVITDCPPYKTGIIILCTLTTKLIANIATYMYKHSINILTLNTYKISSTQVHIKLVFIIPMVPILEMLINEISLLDGVQNICRIKATKG